MAGPLTRAVDWFERTMEGGDHVPAVRGAANWDLNGGYRTTDPDFTPLEAFQQLSVIHLFGGHQDQHRLFGHQPDPRQAGSAAPDGPKQGGEEIDHPVNDLLEAALFAEMDGWQGWQYPLRALLTQGNGYFIIRRMRGNGYPVEMIPAVEGGPQYGPDGRIQYTLSQIREGQVASGNLKSYGRREVLALHWYGNDGLNSPSPIRVRRR